MSDPSRTAVPRDPAPPPARMRIGELARRAAVTVRTIHHYERQGLLGDGDRSTGGHRYYGPDTLVRLEKIRQLKEMGLTLEEIGGILDLLCDDPRTLAGRRRVLDVLRRHLAEADARIDHLRRFRADVAQRIGTLERMLQDA